MKFGLFGGALAGDTESLDSKNYNDFTAYVREADALGFHSAFLVEHHFTGIGQFSATINYLTYLAALTKRIRLGTAVTVVTWHNPALLTEQISTLDLLSGGRADIGVGKGYRDYEFKGFDIPIEEAQERYEECVEFMLKAWTTKGRFSHQGKYWTFNDVVIEPAPVQRPHPPLWIGAVSLPSVEKAAKRGFNLLLDQGSPVPAIAERIKCYKDTRAAMGQAVRPQQIGLTRSVKVIHSEEERRHAIDTRVSFFVNSGAVANTINTGGFPAGAPSAEMIRELAEKAVRANAIIGYPDEVIAQLRELEAVGADYILISDTESTIEDLRRFANEVMPAFERRPALHAA